MNPSPTYSPTTMPQADPPDVAQPAGATATADIPSQALPSTGNVDKPRPLPIRFNSSDDANPARRASVQFLNHVKVSGGPEASRSRSRKPIKESSLRRLSSPPPPTQFKPRVSFDTFDNRDASDFSLTLSRKHREYEYTKRSRTFLCGTDANDYSDTALEWLVDELVDDGDEVVCLRVLEKDSKEAREWASGGSGREGRERAYRKEANRMLERIEEKNTEDKAINLVLEFCIGKIQDTIQRMIRIYEPAILVVGTRGRSLGGFQGLLPGSVSKYCLQHSPVPVIVVRPSSKRDKKKRKRLQDPTRRGYRDILDKSDSTNTTNDAGYTLDPLHRLSIMPGDSMGTLAELEKRDAEEEARMVAEAIGYRPDQIAADGEPLSRVTSARSDVSRRSKKSGRSDSFGSYRSESPDNLRSPARMLKSPELRAVADSGNEMSEFDSDDEDFEPPAPSAYYQAQEEAMQKARERALKAEEEEKERERQAKEQKENLQTGGQAGSVLDVLDFLGGGGDEKKGGPTKGKKRYPIP